MSPFRPARAALALSVVLFAADVSAQQADLNPAEARVVAQTLLANGEVRDAAAIADALLVRDPQDITALVIRSQAAIAAGDWESGVAFGARAYARAATDRDRYIAARLVARAHAEARQDTRAQFWLRRARQFAPTDETRASVAEDYRFLRDRNPLAVSLRFGITPSSNINNGSANETLQLFGLPFAFQLDRAGQPIAGLQISGGTTLAYKLREDRRSETSVTFDAQARTYVIAPGDREDLEDEREERLAACETRTDPAQCRTEIDPVVEGSDFSDATFRLGLLHRQIFAEGMRPTVFRYQLGKTYYGGDPYTLFAEARITQSWDIGERDRVELSVTGQNRRGLDGQEPVQTRGIQGSWLHVFDSGDLLRLTLGRRESMSDALDSDFDAMQAGISYDFATPWNGVLFGVAVDYEDRDYAATVYQPGPRNDETLSGRLSMQFTQVEYYGFQPVVNLEVTRTDSNVDLFERDYTSIGFDLRSSF